MVVVKLDQTFVALVLNQVSGSTSLKHFLAQGAIAELKLNLTRALGEDGVHVQGLSAVVPPEGNAGRGCDKLGWHREEITNTPDQGGRRRIVPEVDGLGRKKEKTVDVKMCEDVERKRKRREVRPALFIATRCGRRINATANTAMNH